MAYGILIDVLPSIIPSDCHVAAILPVDKSGSMLGAPITELNQGLVVFGRTLREDQLALGCVDISVISFDSSVHTEVGFCPWSEYQAPSLSADGGTFLIQTIEEERISSKPEKEYRDQELSYYRPWMFVMTDGAPTDTFREAAAKNRIRKAIEDKNVLHLPMRIGPNADMAKLQSDYPEGAVLKPVLKEADTDTFRWLLTRRGSAHPATPGGTLTLPPVPSSFHIDI